MSFSFNCKAATKAELLVKVRAEMTQVVQNQPIHAVDEGAVIATADAYINMVREDDTTKDFQVSVNGSCWGSDNKLNQINIGVSAGLIDKA